MLRVLGGPKRFCDGMTRRELLQVGSLAVAGLPFLSVDQAAQARSTAPAQVSAASLPGFGRAKACILLFMYGSPSQLETFDPKPDAPLEIRGELGCIPSSVAGLNVCERLPRLAQVMDKVSLIRSVTHPYPIHGVAYATSGIPRIEIPMELNPRDPGHWPFIGSVVDHVDGKRRPAPGVDARSFPATSCSPGRSAAAGLEKSRVPGPTPGSSASLSTRSPPSSWARARKRRKKPSRRTSGKTSSPIAASRLKADSN